MPKILYLADSSEMCCGVGSLANVGAGTVDDVSNGLKQESEWARASKDEDYYTGKPMFNVEESHGLLQCVLIESQWHKYDSAVRAAGFIPKAEFFNAKTGNNCRLYTKVIYRPKTAKASAAFMEKVHL